MAWVAVAAATCALTATFAWRSPEPGPRERALPLAGPAGASRRGDGGDPARARAARPEGPELGSFGGDRAQAESLESSAREVAEPLDAGGAIDDPLEAALRPERARERDWYSEWLRLEREQSGVLSAKAAELLAGDGPRAQKVAFLRALVDARVVDAARWLEHTVRTLPDAGGPRGESVPAVALGLMGRAAVTDRAVRAKLGELAFDATDLHGNLRRRAAAEFARRCGSDELQALRQRLLREPDRSITASALAELDARAKEPAVASWLAEFADWPRPKERDE